MQDDWWNSPTRFRLAREGRERMRAQIERQADSSTRRARKLDTVPVARSRLTANQIDERISTALREHYETFLSQVIAGTTARALDEGAGELHLAVKKFEAEIAELKAKVAELRASDFDRVAEKSAPVDLPRLPLRHRTQMN
jgi:hypothetical protein